MTNRTQKRCPWCDSADDYRHYHDHSWGRPVADSKELFAKLILDGQQAGLSWITILRKWDGYLDAFKQLDPHQIVTMSDAEREALYTNSNIIRSRAKIDAIFNNAQAYIELEQQGVAFNHWLWQFVGGKPIINAYRTLDEVPTQSPASEAMAKALKQQGFKFVGPTICYAFMQAVGMMNDHLVDCHCYQPVCEQMQRFSLKS